MFLSHHMDGLMCVLTLAALLVEMQITAQKVIFIAQVEHSLGLNAVAV